MQDTAKAWGTTNNDERATKNGVWKIYKNTEASAIKSKNETLNMDNKKVFKQTMISKNPQYFEPSIWVLALMSNGSSDDTAINK